MTDPDQLLINTLTCQRSELLEKNVTCAPRALLDFGIGVLGSPPALGLSLSIFHTNFLGGALPKESARPARGRRPPRGLRGEAGDAQQGAGHLGASGGGGKGVLCREVKTAPCGWLSSALLPH